MRTIIDLRQANELLKKYRGAKVQIALYSRALMRIGLRIESSSLQEVLYLVILGCENIQGGLMWQDAQIELTQDLNEFNEGITTVSDKLNHFKLTGRGGFSLVEGFDNEFGSSFENFLMGVD